MRMLLRLFSRRAGPPAAPPWIERLGKLDAAEAEEDREAARALARALHGHAQIAPGLGRREEAVIHASRRRRPEELREAIRGLDCPSALALAKRLEGRRALDRGGLGEAAQRVVETSPLRDEALAALALLTLSPSSVALSLLEKAALSALGAPAAMRVATAQPETSRPALHALLEIAPGIGRALALEEYLRARKVEPGEAPLLFELMSGIEDPLERGWASAPLFEEADAAVLLEENPSLAQAVVLGLEANARGGWRGGPGPGLGRLPGSIRAAEALLRGEYPSEFKERAARAVVEAHPAPLGDILQLARDILE